MTGGWDDSRPGDPERRLDGPPHTLRRCFCGRPVSPTANCGCCCREHDLDAQPTTPARFREDYDPSPEPIDRSVQ